MPSYSCAHNIKNVLFVSHLEIRLRKQRYKEVLFFQIPFTSCLFAMIMCIDNNQVILQKISEASRQSLHCKGSTLTGIETNSQRTRDFYWSSSLSLQVFFFKGTHHQLRPLLCSRWSACLQNVLGL